MMESSFEDFVHDWSSANPKLFTGLWKNLIKELLIPTSRFLV
jgi:hypothetical protein